MRARPRRSAGFAGRRRGAAVARCRASGPRVAEKLAARGLLHAAGPVAAPAAAVRGPHRASRRSARCSRASPAQVEGAVEAVERGFRYRPMLRVAIGDDSHAHAGAALLPFPRRAGRAVRAGHARALLRHAARRPARAGDRASELPRARRRGRRRAAANALDPVYPAIEGIGPAALRRLIGAGARTPARRRSAGTAAARRCAPALRPAIAARGVADGAPAAARCATSTRLLAGTHPAQQRLALEELLAHHLSLRRQRIALQRTRAARCAGDGALARRLRAGAAVRADRRAAARVRARSAHDLAQPHPMLRLVQGDVGSGKTVVAALAAMLAVEAGKQAALMAPTELLAEQHLAQPARAGSSRSACASPGSPARSPARRARACWPRSRRGEAQVVVGTHALMQEGVAFHDLALAIVDEQHRFGVHQRLALRDKGAGRRQRVPHQLVMTATPIPRTLAMAAYADLDVSAIDELPPGRTPVQTVALSARAPPRTDRAHPRRLRRRPPGLLGLHADRRQRRSRSRRPRRPRSRTLSDALPDVRVGLVHGRMKAAEKQATMRAFKRGRRSTCWSRRR